VAAVVEGQVARVAEGQQRMVFIRGGGRSVSVPSSRWERGGAGWVPYRSKKNTRREGGLRWRKKLDRLEIKMCHRASDLLFFFSSDLFPETRWTEGNRRGFREI
jgi:hypothetical protein